MKQPVTYIPRWAGKYVGIPFDDIHHCWWVVQQVLQHHAHIEVPTYSETSAEELMQVARIMKIEKRLEVWSEVEEPRQFDVVMMCGCMEHNKTAFHTGIMVSDLHVLHIEKRTDSVVLPLTSQLIKHRVNGYYRHRELV